MAMAGKLTETGIKALKVPLGKWPKRHSDGDNLYLTVTPAGSKLWSFFYRTPDGKRNEMRFGSYPVTSLKDARRKAQDANRLLEDGIDPLGKKRDDAAASAKAKASLTTFGDIADDYVSRHRSKFKSTKHAAQWQMTLTKYCEPIRAMPISKVDTQAVLSVLQPIWQRIPETASRLRGRIENVLDGAKTAGFRDGMENPARWKGHLKTLLPARTKIQRGHHAALPFDDIAEFIVKLRTREGVSAWALEFCILTAARTTEILEAQWNEVNEAKAVWTIPRARMKSSEGFRIPLAKRALFILKAMEPLRSEESNYIFPGRKRGRPLSNMAMTKQLERMGFDAITVHGFRSTFRDWAAETTSFPNEICEMALAHDIGDDTEAAYRRGDLFEKRRNLMEAWAAYCEPRTSAKVVPMRRG
jgi:integrase